MVAFRAEEARPDEFGHQLVVALWVELIECSEHPILPLRDVVFEAPTGHISACFKERFYVFTLDRVSSENLFDHFFHWCLGQFSSPGFDSFPISSGASFILALLRKVGGVWRGGDISNGYVIAVLEQSIFYPPTIYYESKIELILTLSTQ